MDFLNQLDILNLKIDEHKHIISNLSNCCSKLYKFRNMHKEELVQDNNESKNESSIDEPLKEELDQCKLVDALLEKATKTRHLFQKRLLTSNREKEYKTNDKLKHENSSDLESSYQFENRLDSNISIRNKQSEYLKNTSRQIKKSFSKTSLLKKKPIDKVTPVTNHTKKIGHIDNNEESKSVMAQNNIHQDKVSNFISVNANNEKVFNDKNSRNFTKTNINDENVIKTSDSAHNFPVLPVNRSLRPSYKPAYLKAPYLTTCQATKKPHSKLKHYSEVNKRINNCSSTNIIKNNQIKINSKDKINTKIAIKVKTNLLSNITKSQYKPMIPDIDDSINNINKLTVSNKGTDTSTNNVGAPSIPLDFLNNDVDNIHASNTRTQVNEANKTINDKSTTDDNYNKTDNPSITHHKYDGFVYDSISLSEIGPYLRMPSAYNKLKTERCKIIEKIEKRNHKKRIINGITYHQDRFLNQLEKNNKENLKKESKERIENGTLLKCIKDIATKLEMKRNVYGFQLNDICESSAIISDFETSAIHPHTCFLHYGNSQQINNYFRLNIQLSLFKIDLWMTSFLNDLLKDFCLYNIADESSDLRTVSKLYRTVKMMCSGRRSAVCVVAKVNKNDSCSCDDDKAGWDDENDKDLDMEQINDSFANLEEEDEDTLK